jgi:hypothetical protein
MRVRLDQVDARGLELLLGRDDRRVVVRSATELQGELITGADTLAVEDGSLARGEATLQLQLGTTSVSSDAGIVLEHVQGRAHRDLEAFDLELRAGVASSPRLVLRIGRLEIEGRVELAGVRLRIDDGEGFVFAERVVIADASLALGGVRLVIDRITGEQVAVGWGRDGLRVDADHVDVASGAFEVAFPEAPAGAPAERAARRLPFALDDVLALLDGVAGDLNVDLALDLAVPVIGRRTATHRFRIPIEDGALDYRKLESDLSTLEDALLDFSVRDGALVLERGIPLINTRGRGKPIVRWELEGADLALAENRRIRLAMLPRFAVVSESDGEPSKRSRVALRQLEARELDARLQLRLAQPPAGLPVRRIDELVVAGNVFHAPDDAPREGRLQARLTGVDLGALALPVGRLQVGVEQLGLEIADAGEIVFADLRPRAVRGTVRGLAITGLRIAPGASPSLVDRADARASDSV